MLKAVKNRELYKVQGRVAESMGSVMDSKCDKRRGLIIEEIWKESIIH